LEEIHGDEQPAENWSGQALFISNLLTSR
jgi:hypothetical protein